MCQLLKKVSIFKSIWTEGTCFILLFYMFPWDTLKPQPQFSPQRAHITSPKKKSNQLTFDYFQLE